MRRIAPRRHNARASDTPGRTRPGAPPRRLRDCRACARRSGPGGHGSARRAWHMPRCRRRAPGAPLPRRSSPRYVYPRALPGRHTRVPSGGRACDAALCSRGISHEGHLQVCCHGAGSMSTRATLAGCLVLALSLAGCYEDDTTATSLAPLRPRITVRLTDAPFPYDSLHSVNIYVVRIEAEADTADTSSGSQWTVITEPRKTFDLLALQQGATAILGQGEMPAGHYRAVRMTIDTSLSSITWNDAAQHPAPVNWHGWSTFLAFVEYPVDVPTQGADIVLDFDVGRSFEFNFYSSNNEFDFTPHLRAINSAAAGAIAGVVTQGANGTTQPVSNAQVSVYGTYPGRADSAYLEATGRSDGDGHYKVAFLPPGSYVVRIEEPFLPNLDPVITSGVQVTAGNTTPLSVLLPNAGSSGGAYVRITGRLQGFATITATSGGLSDMHRVQVTASSAPVATVTVVPADISLTVGDSVAFRADLKDSGGNLLSNRSVSWYTADSTIIQVYSYGTTGIVFARAAGTAVLHATSEGKTGQATITVAVPAPVATVTVVPGSASLTVGDNATFSADLRDAAGNVLSNRAVSWSSTDPSVLSITSTAGASATVRALSAGTAVLRATSEGKTGQATVTVAAPAPVATVTVVPESASVALSDTLFTFWAELRDSAGNMLSGRPVSWFSSDTAVFVVVQPGYGNIQPRAAGTAFVQATSEGKTGQAKVVVH